MPTFPLMTMGLVSPTLQKLAPSPASLAALIAAQLLLAIEVLNTFTVTLQVLSAGAVWLVPAATLTVMVTVP